jgi:hypothetical protein
MQYFVNHPVVLGGPEVVVELDEAVLVKRKYNRKRRVNEKWGFAGREVVSKACFCFVVPNRTRETLFSIIFDFVRPGNIIYTDSAMVY